MAEIIGQRQKPDFLKNVLIVVGIVLLIIAFIIASISSPFYYLIIYDTVLNVLYAN